MPPFPPEFLSEWEIDLSLICGIWPAARRRSEEVRTMGEQRRFRHKQSAAEGQRVDKMRNQGRLEQTVGGVNRLVAPIFLLSPLVTAAAPRITWLFLVLVAMLLIGLYLRRGEDWRSLVRPTTQTVTVLLVAAYALLGALWAAKPSAAIEKSLVLSAAALVIFAASRTIADLDATRLAQAARAIAAGVFIGAVFVFIELLTDGAITRFAANTTGWLKPPSEKHADIVEGEIVRFASAEYRRSAALLVFNLWPALLALTLTVPRPQRAIFLGLLVATAAAPILYSERMSSQLALVGSLVVFALAHIWPRAIVRSLAALWCLGFVLILPAAFFAYNAGLHLAPWAPLEAKARIIVWEFTAERVLEHPWLGIGAGSTQALKVADAEAEQPEGFVYPRTTGAHAHNLFLQTWYELGLVGVILVALAGALLVLRISCLPAAAQPFAAATFTAFLATVSTSWSMWQVWLICGVGLMLLYLLIAARQVKAAGS
jgi:O-antigen ligase